MPPWELPAGAQTGQGMLGGAGGVLDIQGRMQRNQLVGQEMQGQNMLRRLYQDPNALDPNTGFLKPPAVNMLGQVSPDLAMQYMQHAAQIQRTQQAASLTGEKVRDEHRQFAMETMGEPGVAEYDRALAATGRAEEAQRAGQAAYTQGYEALKRDGRLSPNELSQIDPSFNYARAKTNILGYKGQQEQEAKARAEGRDVQRTEIAERAATRADEREKRAEAGKWEVRVDSDGTNYRYNVTTKEMTTLAGQPYEAKAAGRVGAATATGGTPLTDEAIDQMARRSIAGDRGAVQGLGFGSVGANNRTRVNNRIAEVMKERGMTAEDIAVKQNEFKGQAAEFQALGRRTAGIETAVQELSNTMPAMITASEKVNRTQVPLLNQALVAAERGTGDEGVIQFGLAVNAVMKAYAQAMNPTGIARASDIDRAEKLLSTAWTKGQIKAAVDQMQIEVRAAQSAPKDVWDRIVKEAGDRARGEGFAKLGTGSSPPVGSGAAAPASPPQGGGAGGLPADLPPVEGLEDGTTARDGGKVIAIVRGGKWVSP